MTTDIMERLRQTFSADIERDRREAADEIERLRAEMEEWRNGFWGRMVDRVQGQRLEAEAEIERLREENAALFDERHLFVQQAAELKAEIERLTERVNQLTLWNTRWLR